jgi:hypothetical protein
MAAAILTKLEVPDLKFRQTRFGTRDATLIPLGSVGVLEVLVPHRGGESLDEIACLR